MRTVDAEMQDEHHHVGSASDDREGRLTLLYRQLQEIERALARCRAYRGWLQLTSKLLSKIFFSTAVMRPYLRDVRGALRFAIWQVHVSVT